MAQFTTWLTRDLSRPNTVEVLDSVLCQGDNSGNRIGVRVTKGGTPCPLTGTVKGFIVKSDGITAEVNGLVAGNSAWIYLPPEAYSVPGRVQIAIRLTNGSEKTVLAACVATVIRVETDETISE